MTSHYRDDTLTVEGGEVTRAMRKDRDAITGNVARVIAVTPSGTGDVTVTLPETTPCSQEAVMDGGRRYNFQPPIVSRSIRPPGPIYLRQLHLGLGERGGDGKPVPSTTTTSCLVGWLDR